MEAFENASKHNKGRKIQLIAAIVVTVLLAVSVFTFAWFSWQSGMKSVVKVKNPSKIQILAGETEDVKNVGIGNISLESLTDENRVTQKTEDGETSGYSKQYVFCVCSENDGYGLVEKYKYTIQLGHTDNLGFTYKLYKVTGKAEEVVIDLTAEQLEQVQSGKKAVYETEDKSAKYLYTRGDEITLTDLNADISETYDSFTAEEEVQEKARTMYAKSDEQTPEPLTSNDEEYEDWKFVDYYILEVCWDKSMTDDPPENKETDMVYLVVYDNQNTD